MNRTMWICTFALACAFFVACPGAHGGQVMIVNPGFETPALVDDDWAYTSGDPNEGWGYYNNDGNHGPWNPTTTEYPAGAPEGQNVGWTEPGEDGTGAVVPGGYAQVLTEKLKVGMTYTLTVEVGNAIGYDWGGYAVQLLAGGTQAPGGTYSGEVTGGTLLNEDDNELTIADGTFETSTVTYTYDPQHSGLLGEPLQIRLLALGWDEVEFDDVRLDVVPEPATMSLLALGGIALLRRKRK